MQIKVPQIVEVFKFLPTGIFYTKLILLCKRVAFDIHLQRYMCKRHLGVIDDFELEKEYRPESNQLQYDSLDQLRNYLLQFPRKAA